MKFNITGAINADVVQIGREIVNTPDGTDGVEVEIRRDDEQEDE